MFKNYASVAFRNPRKYKGYSFINVFGVNLGLACCLSIALFVQNELSYDRYHEKVHSIFRLNVDYISETGTPNNALSSAPMSQNRVSDFPEVYKVVRFYPSDREIWLPQ